MRGVRAWHTKLNRYLKDDEFFIGADGKVRNDSFGTGNYEEAFDTSDFDSGYIIREDATGLKDKNGKEIYEGDIVQTLIRGVWTTGNSDAIFGEKMWKLVVFWADADCGFLFKVIGSKSQPNGVYDILDQHLGAFEVIGNIHENPELLEEEE